MSAACSTHLIYFMLDWTRIHRHKTVIMPLVLDWTRIHRTGRVWEVDVFLVPLYLTVLFCHNRVRSHADSTATAQQSKQHWGQWSCPICRGIRVGLGPSNSSRFSAPWSSLLALRDILALVSSISFFPPPYNSRGNAHKSWNYWQDFSNILIICPFLTSRCFFPWTNLLPPYSTKLSYRNVLQWIFVQP